MESGLLNLKETIITKHILIESTIDDVPLKLREILIPLQRLQMVKGLLLLLQKH